MHIAGLLALLGFPPTDENLHDNGLYQLGTLVGEILGKWVNGFCLKPYKGRMPENPFQKDEDPQDPEHRPEEGQVPGVTDPVQPDITGN